MGERENQQKLQNEVPLSLEAAYSAFQPFYLALNYTQLAGRGGHRFDRFGPAKATI